MKKLFVGIFVLVLFSNFVVAQTDFDRESFDFKETTNELLVKEIQLSEQAKNNIRFLFGFEEDSFVDFQTFSVLICLLILFLFLFRFGAKIFLSNGFSWLVASVLVLVLSFVGVLRLIVSSFFAFSDRFSIFRDFLILRFFLVVLILLILFFVVRIFIRNISRAVKKEESRKKGEDISYLVGVAKTVRETSEP